MMLEIPESVAKCPKCYFALTQAAESDNKAMLSMSLELRLILLATSLELATQHRSYRSSSVKFPDFSIHGMTISLASSKQ